jgi:putative hydrolase of the HAD superfamily
VARGLSTQTSHWLQKVKTEFHQKPIKLISFDLDDTLWDGQSAVRTAQQAMHNWLAQHHPVVAEKALKGRYLELRKEVTNEHPELIHNLTFIRKEILRRLFLENTYTKYQALAHAESAFNIFFEARNKVSYFENALHVIKNLQTEFQIAALTNGNADINATGLTTYIDYFYSAELVGAAKPDTSMFKALLIDADIKAEECIHIGDHPEHDIRSAQSIGINAVWFNAQEKKWPGDSGPKWEIKKFSQLQQVIHDICLHRK